MGANIRKKDPNRRAQPNPGNNLPPAGPGSGGNIAAPAPGPMAPALPIFQPPNQPAQAPPRPAGAAGGLPPVPPGYDQYSYQPPPQLLQKQLLYNDHNPTQIIYRDYL